MLQAYQMMPLYIKGDHKKYGGNLSNVSKSIDLDMKHGVTKQEVFVFFNKVEMILLLLHSE